MLSVCLPTLDCVSDSSQYPQHRAECWNSLAHPSPFTLFHKINHLGKFSLIPESSLLCMVSNPRTISIRGDTLLACYAEFKSHKQYH